MPSLHAAGWRQGSTITADIVVTVQTVADDGSYSERIATHGSWMLVEQDCDLDQTEIDDNEKAFELRPIRAHAGDVPSAITGGRVRIDDRRCLHALDLAARVTARWLAAHISTREDVPEDRRREIKTWLGYRFDRPAVPNDFIPTHRRLLELAKQQRRGFDMGKLRDVFVTYETPATEKVIANLYAVVHKDTDTAAAQSLLARIRDAISDDESHIVREIAAGSPDDMPMRLLETGFSLYGDRHSLATATP